MSLPWGSHDLLTVHFITNLMSFQSLLFLFSSDIYLHILYRYRFRFRYTEIDYFKDLAHVMIQVGRSKICRFCQQAGNTGRS